ncbi:UvrD-helicase domain-containing protein [Bartonella sp. TP]|uniref:ATP-dependent helicase n=1 Tax=Bartonella sp. TP TaxID=3057550 RepID=UPI0025B08798|nr:UvrD-helicase domain-containing protein [Bartonella sp. TP]WJW79777.1 UvrD-helicase domain-containing protein [Bartonella sp. TP]
MARKQKSKPDYISILNPTQQEIVENTEGALLVLAGAGTGKTKTLTTRVVHILHTGLAQPDEILCVTFTNKAAKEMKLRIEALIGADVNNMTWLGTFHGIGAKFLHRHAQLIGLKNDFTIIDKDDRKKILKKILETTAIKNEDIVRKTIADNIELWKGSALLPTEISEAVIKSPKTEAAPFLTLDFIRNVYTIYQQTLKNMNVCDFGDLLMYTGKILQHNPDILSYYQKKFRYILVDEYQDTNLAQYLFLNRLARRTDGSAPNICCVGDDDQSIYSWRGANTEHMLRFTKDFPEAKIIRLERNYRSRDHILNTANQLIAKNANRLGKQLYPNQPTQHNAKIYYYEEQTGENEADRIVEIITRLHSNGQALNDMAVLVRSRMLLTEFEGHFTRAQIKYRLVGSSNRNDKKENKDLHAYLALLMHPNNNLAFERIINTPRRGLGKTNLQKIRLYAENHQLSLYAALVEMVEAKAFPSKLNETLNKFIQNFKDWSDFMKIASVKELAINILDKTGYKDMLLDKDPEGEKKLQNLNNLINEMAHYESLNVYLEAISLQIENTETDNLDAVNLMTMHAAKGLEFETVLLPGWEKDFFPFLHRGNDIEEERRLAYVAITRAKNNIYITYAKLRYIYGKLHLTGGRSNFINELPSELLQHKENIPFAKPKTKINIHYRHNFQIGDRISSKLGFGTIVDIEGDKLTVDFDNEGKRPVMANWAKFVKD